ncbi:MAG: OmpA family protein, partial [Muribaculaceae bacterium]|nr:OmpA family protein [Muribaculaceae bacterium]
IADTAANYGHPAVSPSGRWRYVSSDRDGGNGGRDLWRMSLGGSGRMENLGDDINTGADEMFPYLLTDSIIYFSSNGHPGFGGLDIFRGVLLPSGRWSVENIGAPINSAADDFGMTFESTDPQSGFFSSNRGDNRGYDHIYSFVLPDLKINISGSVTDLDEEPVRGAVIRIVGDDGTNRKAVARNDGTFSFPLERGVRYAMLAGAKGYLNAQQEFTSDLAEEDAEYNVDFALASVEKPNIVENIFYDFDKATLRPESKSALDGLVKMLADNPGITIEMGAHTDRVGSDAYNDKLSERRAKSVVDYLIKAGISADRLQARGYAKTQPKMVTKRIAREFPQFTEGTLLDDTFVGTLSDDDKAAADQINRRTEFRILSLDYGLY